tara:strand:+ start:1998 stop:2387 length:390 start_codon:yes stop_codon:yes gene_type:complete
MNNQKIEKDNLSIWYVSCFMGIGFFSTEIINSLFFQTTKNVIIRLPIQENYGNQYILFKIIFLFIFIFLIKKKTLNIELISTIIWFICLINSIVLRFNAQRHFTITFLFIQLLITLTSFIALRLKSSLR